MISGMTVFPLPPPSTPPPASPALALLPPLPLPATHPPSCPPCWHEACESLAHPQHGGTFAGLLIGLLLGLAIAVGVALYVAKSPIPFIDKVSKPLERAPAAKSMADAPDPNMSMYPRARVEKRMEAASGRADPADREGAEGDGREDKRDDSREDKRDGMREDRREEKREEKREERRPDRAGERASAQESAGSGPVTPPPVAGPAPGASKGARSASGSAATSSGASSSPTDASAQQGAAKSGGAAPGAAASAGSGDAAGNYVQAGAFKVLSEAEALKARLALLGLESRVVKFDQGEQVFFRVRLGPYPRGEELNRARNRLLEAGVDAVVVKQP